MQIRFEKCTAIFYFESREVGIYKRQLLFVALTSMEPLRMFTHFYAALLLIKTCFCKTRNVFFFSSTRRRLTKLLTVSESSIKLKFRSDLKLFVIFLISAVICKQKLFDGNEIAQYLQS